MKTILVIEDDPFIRESIGDVLELEGYQVVTAANGAIGVALAFQHLPDLILCDVSMPEMDGFEVLESLQQHPETNTIPFVFLTARTTKADQRQGMNLGADDYLAKPCTVPELLNTISRRFEKRAVVQAKSEKQLENVRLNIAQSLPHELYTPLNGILGFSELLRDYDNLDQAEIQEIGEAIHTSALRLHHLLKNFVLYSKLELIAHHPEQAQFLQIPKVQSAAAIIQATAQQVAQQTGRLLDLQLQTHTNPGIGEVPIGEPYLQKIVEELVDNAFKFSAAQTPVVVEITQDANEFVLRVTNQGRGMTPEQIANIGAYVQFNRKHYEQQGLGLGVIISKRITELCGGSFHIYSIPNQTITVQVRFRGDLLARPLTDPMREWARVQDWQVS
ncbi:MAG: hybrid sensor histidine kinase/response regulator [Leptolyngbya sp. IPPAS B-1204]|nr:response regulator [Elainella sp. C42_A2020_010]RNJ67374.1 MAG: hybrid sensor histidine kinase/response regulator [Leptolyngbya sp. IPPAS B-1204]